MGIYMNNSTKIYLIRHGESLGNAMVMFLGHTDLDLSELGYKQAFATAKALSDVHFDKIYSSDLIRAYNTALPHAKMRGLEVESRENLREVYVGAWEGKRCSEISEKYGNLYHIDWHDKYGTFVFPEGDSVIDAGKRFYNEVLSIAKENIGKTVLIASHGAVIRSSWAMIASIAPEDIAQKLPFPTNASFSTLEFDGEKLVPLVYSCDAHLLDVGITQVKF